MTSEIGGTNFYDLPAELRIWIYEWALAPTLQCADDPWTLFPPWSRFQPLLDLALTSRQVSEEVTSLFYKKFAPRVRLYFDDAVRLHDFVEWAMRRPGPVRRMIINLRVGPYECSTASYHSYNGDLHHFRRWDLHPYECPRCAPAISLIMGQPGFDRAWLEPPGLETPLTLGHIPTPDSGRDCDVLHPDCMLQRHWHHSVRRVIGRHNALTWPPFGGSSLSLTTYECVDRDCRDGREYHESRHDPVLEFQGEIRDLDFSFFNAAARRAEAYHGAQYFASTGRWSWDVNRDGGEDELERKEPSEVDSWAPSSWYPSEEEDDDDGLDPEGEGDIEKGEDTSGL